jgi:hypothetical protein
MNLQQQQTKGAWWRRGKEKTTSDYELDSSSSWMISSMRIYLWDGDNVRLYPPHQLLVDDSSMRINTTGSETTSDYKLYTTSSWMIRP